MVSIFSSHFFNWVAQLKDSGHQIYWLDVYDSNTYVEKIDFVEQIIGWRYRWDYPGRYTIKKNIPILDNSINKINERNFECFFQKKLREIQPDVVHSFSMQIACYPIEKVMFENPEIKWIYSSWGSDMFYYSKNQNFERANRILGQIDFMFSDCERDLNIAKQNNFTGEFLGVFPGRGGYKFNGYSQYLIPFKNRNIILVKGYQGKHGRCIEVLKALLLIKDDLIKFEIIIFGASKEVIDFVNQFGLKSNLTLKAYGKLPHDKIMELMGAAKIYIGNSRSDGIPNSLLEAIVMEAYPIQSNPGGVTEELVQDRKNGRLIYDPLDIEYIAEILKNVIVDSSIEKAIAFNSNYVKPKLERETIREQVLKAYFKVEQSILGK